MTQISRYIIDTKVTGSDKWIGSDSETQNTTKNFTPTKLAVYFNENQVIDIGTPIRYRYDILQPLDDRLRGTITFEPQVGTPYNFSDITNFILSKYTLKQNDVSEYLTFLVGKKILISSADDVNIFGYYRLDSLIENLIEPNFFDVTLTYLTGNGAIVEDKDYLISLVDAFSGDTPTKTSDLINDGEDGVHPFITAQDVVTPTLQQVVNTGNGVSNFGGIGTASIQSTNFTNNRTLYLNDNSYPTIRLVDNANASHNLTIDLDTLNLNGVSYNWSSIVDTSGFVPYTGATQAVNLGSYDLTVNSITVGKGSGSILTNTAIGFEALKLNTTGQQNTALGYNSLRSVTTGGGNIGIGVNAGYLITTGGRNNFIGLAAGAGTTTGSNNTFMGDFVGRFNTTGSANTLLGKNAGFYFATGNDNTALGYESGYNNESGNRSVFAGYQSGYYAGSGGVYAISVSNSVLIGSNTRVSATPATNQIVIGDSAIGIGDNTVTLGNDSIVTTTLKGNVGIGTTAPSQKLHVSGNVRITGAIYDSNNSPGTLGQVLSSKGTQTDWIDVGTVTSIGMTVPSAFNVTPSTITSSGTFAITGAGVSSQYIRGDGTLANFPTSTGGGASVSYYLNGSISQGTFGGDTYYQMSRTPILGAGTNFIRTNGAGNGYIASFITDAGDPNQLNIPGGNWNVEFYFNASSGGGSPSFYAELYKVSAANIFTLIASDSLNPEGITNGTVVDQYFTSIPVPQTTLLITDRLAVRIFVNTGGRTITLHTENGNLSEVLTTFSSGLTALNGLTSQVQYFAVGTSGTDFNISSATDTHTFNLPTASAVNRGALSSADWTAFNSKFTLPSFTSGSVLFSNGTTIAQDNANFFWDDTNNRLGIGTTTPAYKLDVQGTGTSTPLRVVSSGNTSILLSRAGTTDNGDATLTVTNSGALNITANNVIRVIPYSSEIARFSNTGLAIGATTANARLDVRAPGALSTDIGFKIRNSADTLDLFNVLGNGNVGIGTNAPSQKLEVVGNVIVNSLAPFIDLYSTQTGTPSWKIYNSYNVTGDFSIVGGTSVSNKFRIQPNGNVGIGSLTPTEILEVSSTGTTGLAITRNALANASRLFFKTTGTYNWSIGLRGSRNDLSIFNETSIEALTINSTTNNVLINNTTDRGGVLQVKAPGALSTDIAFKIRNSADNADLFNINGLGNVGIGVGTPAGKLDLFDSASSSLYVRTGSVGANWVTGTVLSQLGTYTDHPLVFKTNDTARMRIVNTTGNVLINTITDIPSSKLTVESTTQGFLPPRMTTAQRNAIASPATGLIVYDTTLLSEFQYNGTAWVTYQSQLNGTGFVKASGTTISYDNSVYAPIIAKDFVNDGVSGTTVNTIIRSYLIPSNTFVLNDSLDILCSVFKNTTSNNVNIRVYFNTSVSLTGAILVGTYALTSTTKFINFQRTNIYTGSSFYCFPATVSSITDRSVTNIDLSVVPFDNLVNNYIIFAIQLSNSLDGGYIGGIRITK